MPELPCIQQLRNIPGSYRRKKQTKKQMKTTPCLPQPVNSTQCALHLDKLYDTLGTRILHVTEKIEEIISFHTTVIFISKVLLMFIKRVKKD